MARAISVPSFRVATNGSDGEQDVVAPARTKTMQYLFLPSVP